MKLLGFFISCLDFRMNQFWIIFVVEKKNWMEISREQRDFACVVAWKGKNPSDSVGAGPE